MKRASKVIANFEREVRRALQPSGLCPACTVNGKSMGWTGVMFVTPSGASSQVIGGCPVCGRVCGVKAYGVDDDRDGAVVGGATKKMRVPSWWSGV